MPLLVRHVTDRRYTEADTPRPFEVPLGKIGGWICVLPEWGVVCFIVFSAGYDVWAGWAIMNVLIAVAYVARRRLFGDLADPALYAYVRDTHMTCPYGRPDGMCVT